MMMSIDGTGHPAHDDETPTNTGDNSARRPEQADGQQTSQNNDRGHRRAETLTREEYADAARAGGPPVRQDSPDTSQSPRSGSNGQVDIEEAGRNGDRGRTARDDGDRDDRYAARGPDLPERADTTSSGSESSLAETSTRDQYARDMQSRPPLEQDRAPDHENDPSHEPETTGAGPPADDAELAEPRSLPEVADEARADSGPSTSATGGEQLGEAHQAEADGRDWLDDRFSVVYVDGREVQATHDPADGIWFEGMGEIPDAPIGDPYGTGRAGEVVTSPEEVKRSTYERLNHVLCERFDDIADEIDRDTETIQDLHSKDPPHSPSPTFAGTADRSPEISPMAADHGVDFGHGLEAALVMAVVGAKIVNGVYEKWQQRMRDRHHGSD
jgi:hypothetical protein